METEYYDIAFRLKKNQLNNILIIYRKVGNEKILSNMSSYK